MGVIKVHELRLRNPKESAHFWTAMNLYTCKTWNFQTRPIIWIRLKYWNMVTIFQVDMSHGYLKYV